MSEHPSVLTYKDSNFLFFFFFHASTVMGITKAQADHPKGL